MINILILITKSLDNQWIWLGENWCWTCQVFPLVINFSIVLQSTWCHLGGLIYWLITSLIEWLSDCPTNGLTDYIYWLTDGLTDWLTEWWTDWLTWRLNDSVTDKMADLLTDWRITWLTNWLTEWLTYSWLTNWQTDWLISWLALLTDWLAFLLIGWLCIWQAY